MIVYLFYNEENMLYFVNDYSEGAHDAVLSRLIETNMESLSGYGADKYTMRAKEKIKLACGGNIADVYFLVGGTQTNQLAINSMLDTYEGVISAHTGHIGVHEAGAIEFTGHKVLPIQAKDGKISADSIKSYLSDFYADESHEHMVSPGMVYISHPTEYGTLYSKKELSAISEVCKQYNIPLYLDGARLGYALACEENDLTLPDIAELCDTFYIGGTKVGALCGEALVFTNKVPSHIVTRIKQNGALLAKGRLTGIQFDALFTDDLYFKIGKNAIDCAKALRCGFAERGYKFFINSPTNQTFIILENSKMATLREQVKFDFWEKYDDSHTVVRFCTSWATKMDDVDKLISII